IALHHFKQASRLIEPDGSIFSGPRSAYRTFTYGSSWGFLDKWYAQYGWFRKMSDWLYMRIAKNRSLLFRLTKLMFGGDPENTKPFWVIYLALIVYFIYISLVGLPL
ncbi:MAG TPA: thiol-disulfide oxidoreductase, partial [Cryomorphaceae bacterium]|nr:thiol-disulfide oxidoreductase [Cryomorphaceae bacterium]